MTAVCDVLREILPEGLIVYTEDKYGNRAEETCDGKSPLNMPLVVLVNEGSAVLQKSSRELCRIIKWEPLWERLRMEKESYRRCVN